MQGPSADPAHIAQSAGALEHSTVSGMRVTDLDSDLYPHELDAAAAAGTALLPRV